MSNMNGITSSTTQAYDSKSTSKTKSTQSQATEEAKETKASDTNSSDVAAVYEKSEEPATKNKVYQRDDKTVARLLEEAERRSQSLRDLVQRLLLKQGRTVNDATDIYAELREGKVDVDPETRAQAQKDIAEDGYWGVSQTSDRMVSFAKALTGGDPSKADEMIEAVKKGYEQAEKAWGGSLPDISKKTMDATIKKLEDWRDGKDSGSSMSQNASKAFSNQAAASKAAE